MPLPGGASDKFGNRYEGRWTVAWMIAVMDESADSIRLEPPVKQEKVSNSGFVKETRVNITRSKGSTVPVDVGRYLI